MVSVNNLSVEFSTKPLFSNVGFVINKSEKIALTGKNGAGKSTLLKIIAGEQNPTSGSVEKPEGIKIGYLPQVMNLTDNTTVREEAKKAFAEVYRQKEQLEDINRKLENFDGSDVEEYEKLITRMEHLRTAIAINDEGQIEGDIEKTLSGLGFESSDFDRLTSEFSGGWRMRIELAKILLRRPDLLLLDEPTNHLDIESIQWLESFIMNSGGALLLVSHDRAFLDNVTTRTIEINCGRINDYKVNYSQYILLREERLQQQLRAYENQQKQIADIKDFIERFRYKPTKSNQVQSRIKMLEKIVPIEVDEIDRSRLHLKFPPAPRSGDFPIIAEGVGKSFGEHHVFDNVNFTLRRGEKVAFVGKNGQGKTTMVRCILNEIPYSGTLKTGHNVNIGYFAQNQASLLDGELTVFETIDNVATGDMRLKVRDILGAFMFGGENIDKKVKVLSGGEKTRLAMIRLLLTPVNLLILDEPTNHLDITSKEVLKEAIKNFDGTAIIVSHDRDFMDGLVDKVYEFHGGAMRENLGGITGFLNELKQSTAEKSGFRKVESTEVQGNVKKVKDPAKEESVAAPKKEAAVNYAQQKEMKRLLTRLEKKVKDAEEEIERLENEKKMLEDKLSAGDSSTEILDGYAEATKKLENAMSIWEIAQQELDDFKEGKTV